MRLTHCRIQNTRLHRDLQLAFAPGLTLIGGANETGKSTLVEALHRALFLKASATGGAVAALRSRLHAGHPTVELGFEAGAEQWTLEKRFSGASGTVALRSRSGRSLNGPEAEELLAALLGVSEIVGSRQAGNVLPTRWAHLWVMQGRAGDDLLAQGRGSYDLDELLRQLEQGGGAAMQSALDQQVAALIDSELAENFTETGRVKANSPLRNALDAEAAAQAVLQQAEAQLADFERASEELAALEAKLTRLQGERLPALIQQRRAFQENAARAAQLQAALDLKSSQLEPHQQRLQSLRRTAQELADVTAQLQDSQARLTAASEALNQGQARAAQLAQQQQQREGQRLELQQARRVLEQQGRLVQKLLTRARQLADRDRIRGDLTQLRERLNTIAELQTSLAALAVITREDVSELRTLAQDVRDARARQAAMAAGVQLLRANQQVRIDGQPLLAGEERQLSEAFEVAIGDDVVLRITPGGGQALADSRGALTRAEAACSGALQRLAVDSLAAAEAIAGRRASLEQQLALLAGGGNTEDPTVLEQRLAAADTRLAELEGEIGQLAEVQRALEAAGPLPTAEAELDQLHGRLQGALAGRLEALGVVEEALDGLRLEVAEFAAGLSEARLLRGNLVTEIEMRVHRRDAIVAEQGDDAALAAAMATAEAQVAAAGADIAALEAQLQALDCADAATRIQGIDADIERLEQECDALINDRGAGRQRCDGIAAGDPYAALEQAGVALGNAQDALRSIQRLTAAQQLLRELFREAQADLSSRYTEPLSLAIDDYLRPLVPEGRVCQLTFDQQTGFSGLKLRRGSEFYDFAELSGGMREQLTAALRLSMADVLKQAHDGCLPLVFDDAFANADPSRIALVTAMLEEAVARGLQVILLTCDPAQYGDLGAATIDLAAAAG